MSEALFIQLSVSHISLIVINGHLLVLHSVDLECNFSFTFGCSALIQCLIIQR